MSQLQNKNDLFLIKILFDTIPKPFYIPFFIMLEQQYLRTLSY